LFYRNTQSFWVCKFYYVSAYFYMLVCHALSHMRLSCVNIYYLLTYLLCNELRVTINSQKIHNKSKHIEQV